MFNLLNQLRHSPELHLMALALNDGTLTARLRALGIETHVVPETGASFARLALAARERLTGKAIDIIHSHRYKENLLAFFLAKSLGARSLVSTLHGLPEPSVRATRRRTGAKTRLDYFLLRHGFDRVVAVSSEMKRVLARTYGFPDPRVTVIHNGVPLPPAAPRAGSSSGLLRIGSVGRLDPVKRFDLFVAVAACVRAHTDRVRFSILGDGPLRTDLLSRIEALRLDDCIELCPSRPDPLAYYQSLDIYLNTSLHEGLPLSILEAMACGTPVVAPRVGGIPEIVSPGVHGVLVESSEPQEFARSCLQLVANGRQRAAMGESARRRVAARFRDTRMAEAHRHLYLELSQRPAAAPASTRRRLMAAPQRS
jgi:glycosyltransferase involved in cell wall biosynthesis